MGLLRIQSLMLALGGYQLPQTTRRVPVELPSVVGEATEEVKAVRTPQEGQREQKVQKEIGLKSLRLLH